MIAKSNTRRLFLPLLTPTILSSPSSARACQIARATQEQTSSLICRICSSILLRTNPPSALFATNGQETTGVRPKGGHEAPVTHELFPSQGSKGAAAAAIPPAE